jgi:hypothetical protein
MGQYTKISQDAFNEMQLDAGVLLTEFDPTKGTFENSAIVCATTGGINASCVPTFSDLGDDVDNCPVNMKELKHLDSWECKMSFTALTASADVIKMALGCAETDGTSGAIKPRRDLKQTDFADVWWVGDRTDGGMVAICLKDALSTGGFTLQTTKNGKGQFSVELTGHVSIETQDVMPMEFYSKEATAA